MGKGTAWHGMQSRARIWGGEACGERESDGASDGGACRGEQAVQFGLGAKGWVLVESD